VNKNYILTIWLKNNTKHRYEFETSAEVDAMVAYWSETGFYMKSESFAPYSVFY
jgi:hypothetical protein